MVLIMIDILSRATHKHGLLIKLSKGISFKRAQKSIRIMDNEEISTFGKNPVIIKIVERCILSNHAPEDCDSRLPFVEEAAPFPILTLNEWLIHYT